MNTSDRMLNKGNYEFDLRANRKHSAVNEISTGWPQLFASSDDGWGEENQNILIIYLQGDK